MPIVDAMSHEALEEALMERAIDRGTRLIVIESSNKSARICGEDDFLRLVIAFDDADYEDIDSASANSSKPFSDEDAMSILRFSTANHDAKQGLFPDLVVSCDGGSCRSAAVACAIDAIANGQKHAQEKFLDNGNYLPNRLVFDTMMRILGTQFSPMSWDEAFARNRAEFDARHAIDF